MLSPQAEARTRDAFFDLALASRELYPAWVRRPRGRDRRRRRLSPDGAAALRLRGRPGGEPRGADRMAAAGRARRRRAASGRRCLASIAERLSSEVHGRRVLSGRGRGRPAPADPRGVAAAPSGAGVRVRTGVEVLGFRIEGGACRGVETEDRSDPGRRRGGCGGRLGRVRLLSAPVGSGRARARTDRGAAPCGPAASDDPVLRRRLPGSAGGRHRAARLDGRARRVPQGGHGGGGGASDRRGGAPRAPRSPPRGS